MLTIPTSEMVAELAPDEVLEIQARMTAKGLDLEPGNEGEALDYLEVVFARTCDRLDRENAGA